MILHQPLKVTLKVGAVLDGLGIPWVVGGSLASSIHGLPRSTQDVDLVAAMSQEHVAPFIEAMEPEFYVSEAAMLDALRARGSFNVIHQDTAMKVDLFMVRADPLSRAQLTRRRFTTLAGAEGAAVPVLSPEDIILQKLLWFQRGQRVSERQWRDVLGVLKVQGDLLDLEYLTAAADMSELRALLDDALAQARAEPSGA